jgi:integrase
MSGKNAPTFPYTERHGDRWRGWWLDAQGVRRRGPSRVTRADAYEDARLARAKLTAGTAGAAMTIGQACALIRVDIERRERAPGTADWYACQERALLRYYSADAELDVLTADEVQGWIAQRLAGTQGRDGGWQIEPVSAGTVAHHLRFLRRLFRIAAANGWRGTNPMGRIVAPRVKPAALDVFAWDEALDLVERVRGVEAVASPDPRPSPPSVGAAKRAADILEALAKLGIRRSELARLRLEDIDTSAQLLRVHGKRGLRTLPLSDHLVALLLRLAQGGLDPRKPVRNLLQVDVERRARYIAGVVGRWKRRLADPRIRAHNLRRTMATALIETGTPEALVGQILGHAPGSGAVTRLYIAGREPVLREALDRLRAEPRHVEVDVPLVPKRGRRRKGNG